MEEISVLLLTNYERQRFSTTLTRTLESALLDKGFTPSEWHVDINGLRIKPEQYALTLDELCDGYKDKMCISLIRKYAYCKYCAGEL